MAPKTTSIIHVPVLNTSSNNQYFCSKDTITYTIEISPWKLSSVFFHKKLWLMIKSLTENLDRKLSLTVKLDWNFKDCKSLYFVQTYSLTFLQLCPNIWKTFGSLRYWCFHLVISCITTYQSNVMILKTWLKNLHTNAIHYRQDRSGP
jgi:hypothetical protein